jgi:hypothetical protein
VGTRRQGTLESNDQQIEKGKGMWATIGTWFVITGGLLFSVALGIAGIEIWLEERKGKR